MDTVKQKMTAIADAIRLHLMTNQTYNLDQMAQSIEAVYHKGDTDGYQSGYAEGLRAGDGELENYMFQLSVSLSEALHSGQEGSVGKTLEQNIEQAKADILAIKAFIESYGINVPIGSPSALYPQWLTEVVDYERHIASDNIIEEFHDSWEVAV